MVKNIYIIDNILLFNPEITDEEICGYNELDKLVSKLNAFYKVYFVTSDINSIMDITEKITKIFMVLKPLYVILQDNKKQKKLTVFSLFELQRKKKADKLSVNLLVNSVENQIEKMEAFDVQRKYNPEGNPVYLKLTMAYGVQAGGKVAHSTGVLKGLEKRYPKVMVYTTDYVSKEIKKAEIYHISMKRFHDFAELRNFYLNISAYKEIMSIQKNVRPSFVYQRCSLNNFVGLQLAQRFKVPFVLEFNSSEVWVKRTWGKKLKYDTLSDRIESLNLRKADLIVCVSEELKDSLVDRGIDKNKILVNYNGVDEKKYKVNINTEEIRERYNFGRKVIIGFCGSFERFHGAEKLVEAYGNLIRNNEECRNNTRLFLIGEGVRLEKIKRIVKHFKIEDCVVYAGSVPFEQMPLFLNVCDILVAPHIKNKDGSEFFGSPTKLFEYMAVGKAIAASDLNQIGKILVDRETALLFEPGNIEQMERILITLIKDEQLRERLGKNARAEVVKKYTWDIHVDKILKRLDAYK